MSRHEPRMLIYSQDGLGLGHMRRTSLLAGEFLRQMPGCQCAHPLRLAARPVLRDRPGPRLPQAAEHPQVRPGEWEAVSLSASFRDVLSLRRRLIVSAVREFDPDILLVDHMPHGAMGELVPALRRLRGHRAQVVLGLRDILDNPEVVRRRWTAEGAYEALDEYYDEVLVYGSRDVLDVAQEYAWPKGPSQRLSYAGYVCDDPHRRARRLAVVDERPTSASRKATAPPTVLVVAGGGADAYPMFASVLDAAEGVHRETGARFSSSRARSCRDPRSRSCGVARRNCPWPRCGAGSMAAAMSRGRTSWSRWPATTRRSSCSTPGRRRC